jgi:aldose sugar dehydrogenase
MSSTDHAHPPASWFTSFRAWIGALGKRQRVAFWLVAFALLGFAGGAGLVLGYVASQEAIPYNMRVRAQAFVEGLMPPPASLPIEWTQKGSVRHVLDIARVPVGRAWSIAEAGGHIVFASRMGRLGYLTPDNRVAALDLDVPMRLDELRASALGQNEYFEIMRFRTTDLLTVETSPQHYDLYAAHHRFETDCVRIVVSRARLTTSADSVAAVSRDWEQVFQSRDCVRPKDRGAFFAGDQSGGRLVALDRQRLALSIGDFQFDGVSSGETYSMDPNSDLGKIIEIDLATGRASVMASGLRNPQGLMLSRRGELWETEHGPRGGDELNLIRRGANYGWPIATYGMRYAAAPTHWPLSETPGHHEGYEAPRHAWVPSIAVSQLIEPDPREFPNWEGDFIVSSLVRNTLFVMRFDRRGAVAYAEPILLDGLRMRDMISLADGRIALATDDGDIHLIRNAELSAERPRGDLLAGLDALDPPMPDETGNAGSPAQWGRSAFGLYCSQCHTVTGETRVGPSLDGIVGRRVGAAPGYAYSSALADADERWTRARLRDYVVNPEQVYPGTTMPAGTVEGVDLENILAFLATREPRERPQP